MHVNAQNPAEISHADHDKSGSSADQSDVSHSHEMSVGGTSDTSGQCPDGHASKKACCGMACQLANMPSGYDRFEIAYTGDRFAIMVIASAVKQRPTFIERPPKSIDPLFG